MYLFDFVKPLYDSYAFDCNEYTTLILIFALHFTVYQSTLFNQNTTQMKQLFLMLGTIVLYRPTHAKSK